MRPQHELFTRIASCMREIECLVASTKDDLLELKHVTEMQQDAQGRKEVPSVLRNEQFEAFVNRGWPAATIYGHYFSAAEVLYRCDPEVYAAMKMDWATSHKK